MQNKLIPTPEPHSGLHWPSRPCVLGLDNLDSCATPPAQPVCAVNICISPGSAFPTLCRMSPDECPGQLGTTWQPKKREHLVFTAGQAEGFYRCWSGDSRAVSWPAPARGAFPVSLRWSHCYRQVITAPVTLLLVWHCHPNIPPLPIVHENVHPVLGQREQSLHAKQLINILITWKCGCSLSPPCFLHKRSVSWSQYPWSPTATVAFQIWLCLLFTRVESIQ